MSRNLNSDINHIFSGTELFDMGYDLKDLNDVNMLEKVLFDKMAFETRNRNQIASLLTSISDFNSGVTSINLRWNAGDEEASTTLLSAASPFDSSSDVLIYLDIDSLVDGNYVMLHDYDGTDYYEVVVAIRSKKGETVAGAYVCAVVAGSFKTSVLPVVASYIFAVASAQVTVVNTTTPLDGRATDPNFITPVMVQNYMERIRESTIIGTHTNAAPLNFNGTAQNQARIKMRTFLERLNLTLALRDFSTDPETVAGNVGRMMGFSGMFNPADRAATFNGMKGRNAVFTNGTTLDKGEIVDWVQYVMAYGNESQTKVVVGTPKFIQMVFESMMSGVTVQAQSFRVPGSAKLWQGLMVETVYGNLLLLPDYSLQGSAKYIQDNTIFGGSATPTATNTNLWGVCFDTEYTKLVYRDVPGDPKDPGVQKPAIRPVDSYGRDTREQTEANAELTLFLKRPETGGYIGVGA